MAAPGRDVDATRQDAERLHQQLLCSSSRFEAVELAIEAVQASFDALRLTTDAHEKARISTRTELLLRQAEELKTSADWRQAIRPLSPARGDAPPDPANVRVLKDPSNSRKLSTKEQIVLLKSGWLNGSKFPEWNGPPSLREFVLNDGEELFLDESSELPLSDFQENELDGWKRPSEALPPPSWYTHQDHNRGGPLMNFYRDTDLVQDAATDCSVVASLCAGVARRKRGHLGLMQSVIFPNDADSNRPLMSENGKYIVRLNFNGCFRKVVIDDRIPTSQSSRVIHVVDRNNPGLLWPALLEKAYLKVRGGYDFPGSNSATDLWVLTGWIPEQVFLQSDELELDRFWSQMWNGFVYGDVLITMGTGKMSGETERALGLAGQHDYAVLDLRELDGQRLLLIKNPWAEGTSWRGSSKSSVSALERGENDGGEDGLGALEDEMEPVKSPRDLLNGNELTPGTFWMDLDNVVQHFESIYLNWNPGLFSHRQDFHFAWDLTETAEDEGGYKRPRGPYASLQGNRQFNITATGKDTIWILLWRHFQNSVPKHATSDEIESGRHYIDLDGHIALAAYSSQGRRVILAERYLQKGWFVDSPQTLLRLDDCEPGAVYTVVPLEQDLPATNHHFTLTAFSRSSFTLAEAVSRYAHASQLVGEWSSCTAGGNAQHSTYCDNPQYRIVVTKKTSMSLILEACDLQLNVHVKLLHSNGGKRAFRIRRRDIIVDSKDYRPGCCMAEVEEVDPGSYTIICSTFEQQQLGSFDLRIGSSQPVNVTLLPRDGAGRLQLDLPTAEFQHGQSKVAALLVPRRHVNVYAIARHADQTGGRNSKDVSVGSSSGTDIPRRPNYSHVRLSIEFGRGPERRVVVASDHDGDYSDNGGPVRTEPVDLWPDLSKRYGHRDCWLVLERMYISSESQEERFPVELYVDGPDLIEAGAWRAWED